MSFARAPLVVALTVALLAVGPAWSCAAAPDGVTAASGGTIRHETGIVYRTVGRTRLALDACLPASAGSHPAVVLVHGGGFVEGDRRDLGELCDTAARHGIAAFTVDYRLLPHRYPSQVQDVGAAVNWLAQPGQRARFALLPGRTAILGSSAGAVVGAQLLVGAPGAPRLTTPLRGAVLLSGIYDADADLGALAPAASAYLGCDVGTRSCRARAAALSAVRHVSSWTPPALLVNSTRELTPLAQLRSFQSALQAKGVRHDVIVVAGPAHADAILAEHARVRAKVVRFLQSVLGG